MIFNPIALRVRTKMLMINSDAFSRSLEASKSIYPMISAFNRLLLFLVAIIKYNEPLL